MADKARDSKSTGRYLPKAAWAKLTKEERDATDKKKRDATRKSGNKVGTHVPNTRAAAKARAQAHSKS